MRTVSIVGMAALLAACASSEFAPSTSSAPVPPQAYRATVANAVRANFVDPYSIRDASISPPFFASTVFDGQSPFPRKGWAVCMKANAKNRMGGYIGIAPTLFLFEGETIVTTLQGTDFAGQLRDQCDRRAYEPFAEIEQPA